MARSATSLRPATLVTLAALVLAIGGCGRRASLVIVTTNDVLGKTSPCGCHTPKGGLARRAAFLDSLRTAGRTALVLDAGSFFPVTDDERDAGPFMLQAMGRLGTAAAGVGQGDLRYGYAFLREAARAGGVPLVCANLDRAGGGPAFEYWRIVHAGRAVVGVFGLLPDGADLGPARDSLRATPPEAAARRAIAALRAQGARVIVLLSQLGAAQGETLATHVPGIDLVVAGGGVPVMMRGVGNGHAIALYGGTQGWQVGVAEVGLRASGALRGIDARTVVLGPEVRTEPAMAASVKAFEDSLNARLRARDAAYGPAKPGGLPAAHYLGIANCVKCHTVQFRQWLETPHAHAWETLVQQNKDATPACVPCHVTGHGRPGGYRTEDDAPRLGNVQCEACHGMGTEHRTWEDERPHVPESVCRGCHTDVTSPTFRFALYRPHVLHTPPAGLEPLPESPARRLMRSGRPPHGR